MSADTPGREIDVWLPSDFLERYGDDLPAAAAAVQGNAERFAASLAATPDAALHRRPEAERWSPAEVADHVVRAADLFARALERAVSGGDPIAMPRGRLGADGRPLAPEGGEPRPGRPRDELERDLECVHARVVAAAREAAAAAASERLCLHQSFLGPLDALGAARLAAWHVRHHRRQLERASGAR